MGTSNWSDSDYSEREIKRARSGKSAFTYTDEEMKDIRRDQWKVNQKMDPRGVVRESRDSAAHPESLAIMVCFDHTGSMREIPRILQKQLTKLFGLLLKKDYVEHPQILFAAVGDATSDKAPLQVGQFESGIEMDDDLGRLLLEGNGGPYGQESYELGIYFAARHTVIDCWEKRKKKGYLFLIGDEEPYPKVKAREVKGLMGDEIEDIPVYKIIAEAKEKYHLFFIIPAGANGGDNLSIAQRWVELCGQESLLKIRKPEAISETIALAVGLVEGKITLEEGIENLKDNKTSAEIIESVAESLAYVPSAKNKISAKKESSGKPVETKKEKNKTGRL